jgi:hypothetical protein
MLIEKRPSHELLDTSGNLIDEWARNLVSELPRCPEIAAYVLVLTACGRIKYQHQTIGQGGEAFF